ncbi:MAG: hypothetical protein KTR16_02270 [Acidiferrobacterales bacterium]|nr:hypothetical protein [Acidiferrobacterales bacterium]
MVTYENNTLYKNILNNIRTGDVIFTKGSKASLLHILIRFLSGSWFVHSTILVELNGLWFVIETKPGGDYPYQITPLEWWLVRNQNNEIFLGRIPKYDESIASKLRNIVMSSVESLRPYKTSSIILLFIKQVLLKKKRTPTMKQDNILKPLACSSLVQEAWERAGAIDMKNYMTPSCLVNFLGGENELVRLNSSEKYSEDKEKIISFPKCFDSPPLTPAL